MGKVAKTLLNNIGSKIDVNERNTFPEEDYDLYLSFLVIFLYTHSYNISRSHLWSFIAEIFGTILGA